MEENLVLNINTKSGSNYKIYRLQISKKEYINILKSDSKAFLDVDFVLLSELEIKSKIVFLGTVYNNADIILKDNFFEIIPKKDKIESIQIKNAQATTSIKDLEIINKNYFKSLKKEKLLNYNYNN